MKPWQTLFRMAPKRDHSAQGESTGDDDFANEAEDDALANEGLEELEEEGDGEDEPEEDSEEEQSEEDEDPEEEEEGEEEEEEQEEEAPAEDRFKDPKTGDFDFKRINKVVKGDFLEKAFKEQNATITRNFQELKSYKDIGSPQDLNVFRNKAKFIDDLVDNNPVVQAEVIRILNGGQPPSGGRAPAAGNNGLPPGVHPDDPLVPLILEMRQGLQTFTNRQVLEERHRQQQAQEARFSQALDTGKAKFKELTGKAMTAEQAAVIEKEMRDTGYLNSANLVPSLFYKEIQDVISRKIVGKRVAKKNLPKSGSGRRPAPSSKKGRNSREGDRDDLWNKHMGDGIED